MLSCHVKCLDLGISSGLGDGNSSEDEDTDTWLVKNSELSDLGYASYMTENEKRCMRCLFLLSLADDFLSMST